MSRMSRLMMWRHDRYVYDKLAPYYHLIYVIGGVPSPSKARHLPDSSWNLESDLAKPCLTQAVVSARKPSGS